DGRLSREGLLHAMNEALRLHQEETARNVPPPKLPAPLVPEDLSMFKRAGRFRPQGCIHCHMVNEAFNLEARTKEPLPKDQRRESFFSFPLPETIGIQPDLVLGNRVRDIVPQSPAAKAGLKKDDVLRTINGQPVVTVFDIQYGLNEVGANGKLV